MSKIVGEISSEEYNSILSKAIELNEPIDHVFGNLFVRVYPDNTTEFLGYVS